MTTRTRARQRRGPISRGFGVAALVAALSGSAALAQADPLAIWRIAHDQCAAEAEAHAPLQRPCERVETASGEASGVAIIKDREGVAQMLAIPTRRITGVEDPQMLAPDAPDAFAAAWRAKDLVEAKLGRSLPREATAITINSKWARSQDQLHLHVDCLHRDVATALAGYRDALDDQWRAMTVPLRGRVYFARRIDGDDLAGVAPLKLLADGFEGARGHMDLFTLAAVGAEFAGRRGFVLLADRAELEAGGHAEDLQDHDCAIARP